MAIPLIVNGVTFQYPQQGDKNWAPTLTNWSSAVTSGMLQKAGGSFTLTSEVDFGASFGMKVLSIKSEESNIATTGILRLANASTGIVWRNALHNADLALTVNSSNQLTFNGTNIGATTALTDSHILVGNASNQPADVAMSGDISITNAGVTAIGAGKIVNAQINASAAIALTKLASTTAYFWYVGNASGVLTPLGVTASRAVATDANGSPVASATTATELGYVSGVTSAIQTQITARLPLAGGTMSGVLNMGSNKIQSVANGTAAGDAVAFGQMRYFQMQTGTTTTVTATISNGFTATALSVTITPTSSANRIKLTFSGSVEITVSSTSAFLTIYRNGANLEGSPGMQDFLSTAATTRYPASVVYVDSPASTSALTYVVRIRNADNTTTVRFPSSNAPTCTITAEEIL